MFRAQHLKDGEFFTYLTVPNLLVSAASNLLFDGWTPGQYLKLEEMRLRCTTTPNAGGDFKLDILKGDGNVNVFGTSRTFATRISPTGVNVTTDGGTSFTDYTTEATDGDADTEVDVGDLGNNVNHSLVVMSPERFLNVQFDMSAGEVNATTNTMVVKYRKVGGTLDTVAGTDNTASGGASFAQDGTFAITKIPVDWIPETVNGVTGYALWFQWTTADNDAATRIDEVLVDKSARLSYVYAAPAITTGAPSVVTSQPTIFAPDDELKIATPASGEDAQAAGVEAMFKFSNQAQKGKHF